MARKANTNQSAWLAASTLAMIALLSVQTAAAQTPNPPQDTGQAARY